MKFIEKITYLLVIALFATITATASTPADGADSLAKQPVRRTKAQLADSASRVIRVPSEGARIDRGIYQYLFVPKGQVLGGITISYAHLDSNDSQYLLMISGLDAELAMTQLSPFIGISYAKNQVIGAQFVYQRIKGAVDNVSLRLGSNEDYSFTLKDVNIQHQSYTAALFHRAYLGLDLRGRFALFNETRVGVSLGKQIFSYNSTTLDQYTRNREVSITFHPGFAACIMNNVSLHASVGVGGVRLNNSRVYDNNEVIGKRTAANANFRINLTDISLGITLHL